MARGRGYNVCPVCQEAYDCGELHVCEGPTPEPEPPRRVDKHLEACRRMGQYVQPGYTLPRRKDSQRAPAGAGTAQQGRKIRSEAENLRRPGFAGPSSIREGPPAGLGPVGVDVCPRCGKRVHRVRGPEGTAVMREIRPRPFWPSERGPDWAMGIDETWQRGSLTGDRDREHTVAFPLHERVCEGTHESA